MNNIQSKMNNIFGRSLRNNVTKCVESRVDNQIYDNFAGSVRDVLSADPRRMFYRGIYKSVMGR